MAGYSYRVAGHFVDAAGNTVRHFGATQFLVSLTEAPFNPNTTGNCNAAAVNAVLASNGKLPAIPGAGATAVFVIDSYAILDHQFTGLPGILS